MAYTSDVGIALGGAYAGIADLRAQLVNSDGTASGGAVSTGFTEIGQGFYLWHHTAWPDGFRGGVKFFRASDTAAVLAFAAINPEEVLALAISTALSAAQTSGTVGDALNAALAWAKGRAELDPGAKTLTLYAAQDNTTAIRTFTLDDYPNTLARS